MNHRLILITGMSGAGKSTYAAHLSQKMSLPLACYDSIKSREWDILRTDPDNEGLQRKFGLFAYEYLWFFMEELMKSGCGLIVDYFFHPLQQPALQALVDAYRYETVVALFHAEVRVAYERFMARNQSGQRHQGVRVACSFDDFEISAIPNREFRIGQHHIMVDTTDFSRVSYDAITEQIIKHMRGEPVA